MKSASWAIADDGLIWAASVTLNRVFLNHAVLIEENRADRLAVAKDREANERKFSEVLASIVAVNSRVSTLEQAS